MTLEEARSRRIIALIAAVFGATVLVQAHTKLVKSEPAAGAAVASPKQIQLWFNEKVDPAVSKIEVRSASGKVQLGPAHAMGDKSLMAAVSAPMAGGKYTVAWQAAGDDGHVVKGEFTFSVNVTTTH